MRSRRTGTRQALVHRLGDETGMVLQLRFALGARDGTGMARGRCAGRTAVYNPTLAARASKDGFGSNL